MSCKIKTNFYMDVLFDLKMISNLFGFGTVRNRIY